MQSTLPIPVPELMLHPRMHNLVSYAKMVEGDMFEMSLTRSRYYRQVMEKMLKLQKGLGEKREQRRLMAAQRNAEREAQQSGAGAMNANESGTEPPNTNEASASAIFQEQPNNTDINTENKDVLPRTYAMPEQSGPE